MRRAKRGLQIAEAGRASEDHEVSRSRPWSCRDEYEGFASRATRFMSDTEADVNLSSVVSILARSVA